MEELNSSCDNDVPLELCSEKRSKKRENVIIIGDSILNNITSRGLSKSKKVTVINHPSATSDVIEEEVAATVKENSKTNGLLLYIREDIPAKVLHSDFPATESFYAEIIIHKKRWLINCSYNPQKNNICRHPDVVTKTLDSYYSKYENVIFLGNFNAGVLETAMTSFCEPYNLKSITKQFTCFKNPKKPSCIELILKNRAKSFQSTCVIETGLSDFHRMAVSVLKMHFRKLPPKVITYRNFSNYNNANFINSLNDVLNEHENQEHLLNDPDCFYKVCVMKNMFGEIINHL